MVEKDLCLVLQTSERAAVEHPVTVTGIGITEVFLKMVKAVVWLHRNPYNIISI